MKVRMAIFFYCMKVLFCDNSLRELLNFRKEIIKYYVEQGARVVLVAPKTLEDIPLYGNVRYISVEMSRSGMNPWQDWCYFRILYKIYKTECPDYIFHYTIKPNIYGTLAARSNRIPSSAMIAGLGYVFYKHNLACWFARKLYRFALKFSDKVLVLNAANKELLLSQNMVPSFKLLHLKGGEGVDLKYFSVRQQNKNGDEVIFLMISRLLYDKGYEEYVQAARAVKEEYPEVQFQLLGGLDTSYPRHVPEARIYQDHEAGYVRYLGYCSDVVGKIQQADCIVLPSYNEGLSRVLMEALAMGKPVITTDIPGCKETVEEGKNGFLVQPRDVDSLVCAVKKMLGLGREEWQEMGKYSRRKAEREFDITHVVEVYQQITGQFCRKA